MAASLAEREIERGVRVLAAQSNLDGKQRLAKRVSQFRVLGNEERG